MNSRISVLASIILAMLVSSMNSTIMNTTMPTIVKELGRFDLYAWAFASYMIVCTVLSPVAGRISDLFGRKHVFGFGILLFLIGSFLSGISNTMIQLVIFRAIQGLGAGFMIPFPAIIAGDLFSIEQRGRVQAFFTGMWGLSAVLAPLLGAFFVQYMTWRWIFYVNIPICILSFSLLLPYKEVYTPKKSTVDYWGAVFFAGAISLILLVTVVKTYVFLYGIAGVALLLLFYMFEKRQSVPIVPLSLFQNKTVKWLYITAFLSSAALFGTSSYIPLFLQKIRGESLFMSGVALLGTSIGWMAVAVPSGKWILRYGYRPLLIIGNTFLVLSGISLNFINQNTGFWYIFFAMIIQGLSFGLTSTVSIIGSQQLVEPHRKGISTSFQMFSRNIGTAIGVTIMGAFLTKATGFLAGIHHLFQYGLIMSIIAYICTYFIKDQPEYDPKPIFK